MRQREFIRLHSVAAGKQPARQALFNVVESVACRGLRGLHKERLQISMNDVAELTVSLKLALDNSRLHSVSRSADLNECTSGHAACSEQDRNSNNSINSHNSNLDGATVLNRHHHRSHAVF